MCSISSYGLNNQSHCVVHHRLSDNKYGIECGPCCAGVRTVWKTAADSISQSHRTVSIDRAIAELVPRHQGDCIAQRYRTLAIASALGSRHRENNLDGLGISCWFRRPARICFSNGTERRAPSGRWQEQWCSGELSCRFLCSKYRNRRGEIYRPAATHASCDRCFAMGLQQVSSRSATL
jgi:hypothetical protein